MYAQSFIFDRPAISCITLLSMPDLKILLSREQIAKRVAELGAEIARDFQGQTIIFVGC